MASPSHLAFTLLLVALGLAAVAALTADDCKSKEGSVATAFSACLADSKSQGCCDQAVAFANSPYIACLCLISQAEYNQFAAVAASRGITASSL